MFKLVYDRCRRRLTIKGGGMLLCIEWHTSDSHSNASDLRWWNGVFYNQLRRQIHASTWHIGLQLPTKL